MDFQKSKALLDKINALYKNMSGDPRNISSIERDLMRSYVQQFYESFLQLEHSPAPVAAPPPPPPVVETKAAEPKITLRRPETAPPPPPPPPKPEPPKPEPPKVERQPEPAPAPPPPPPPPVVVEKPIVVETPPPPPPPVVKEAPIAPPPPVYQAPVMADPDVEALFTFKTATELSEKLSQLPIGDIKKAMGLNERISTQKELFGNDANAFETTVNALNQLGSFEQAKAYLIQNAAIRYNWAGKDTKEKAKEFIKLVKRRY
ncbi:MAG: hypothetical protein IT258_04270 [Saprospiraceae bacterium]|nr:hypothetical protein [Saprospiraceae bacterium]